MNSKDRYCLFLAGILFTAATSACIAQDRHLYLNGHVMFYDPLLDKLYVFGGADTTKVSGTTWAWEKNGWTKWTDVGPSPRTFPAAVYYPEVRGVFLFGGNKVLFGKNSDTTFLNDTWIFTEGKWKTVRVNHSPPPRSEGMMAYNPITKEIILHGGYQRRNAEIFRLEDTWVFKDGDWKEVSAQSPANNGGILYFDHVSKKIRMIAGRASMRGNIINAHFYNSWIEDSIPGLKIFNPAYAASTTNEVLVFGGYNGSDRVDSTWKIRGGQISQQSCNALCPPKRNHAAMAFHQRENAFYLFGGHDGENVYNDVWMYKDDKWQQVIAPRPAKRVLNDH